MMSAYVHRMTKFRILKIQGDLECHVNKMLDEDWRVTYSQFEEILDSNVPAIRSILKNHLNVTKFRCFWVP